MSMPVSLLSPETQAQVHIPEEYHEFLDVFNKAKASGLPPHWPYACTINLLPGTSPPHSHIYPLSHTEQQAVEEYVQEALQQGCIKLSISPASVCFFFLEKMGGGLLPCITYRSLNCITVKYPYPLPLVPSALEQLRLAHIFTKLSL